MYSTALAQAAAPALASTHARQQPRAVRRMRFAHVGLLVLAALGSVGGFSYTLTGAAAKLADELARLASSPDAKLKSTYSSSQIECAACEAVAQGLEAAMATGAHLGKMGYKKSKKGFERTSDMTGDGAVERMEVLYGMCAKLQEYFPAHLDATETLHFMKVPSGKFGGLSALHEYCESFVEEREQQLLEVMKNAKPLELPPMMRKAGTLQYELKQQVCVEATNTCTADSLMRISNGRIGMAKHNPEMQAALKEYLQELDRVPKKDSDGTRDEHEEPIGQSGDAAARDDAPMGDASIERPQRAAKGAKTGKTGTRGTRRQAREETPGPGVDVAKEAITKEGMSMTQVALGLVLGLGMIVVSTR